MREKLIELLDEMTEVFRFDAWENTDKIADHMIANGVTVQKWIPVTERLPKAYTDVLVYRESGCEVECCIDIQRNFWFKDPTSEYLVTHWMPLPSTEGLK